MINPLQHFFQGTGLPDNAASKKPVSTAATPFDSVLSSVRRAAGSFSEKAHHAAADLLRMEMMRSSLSLAGEGDAPTPSGVQALESLLSGLPGGRAQGVPQAKAPAGAMAQEDKGILGELSAVVSKGMEKAEEIGKTAAAFLGIPYRFGGEGAHGIDCSSFVQQVFREHQIALPRTAREQSQVGTEVGAGDLRKGDLVFFHTYASYPSHVGIYLGDGKMIHASSAKGEVTVTDMNSDYYRSRFMGAKRIG